MSFSKKRKKNGKVVTPKAPNISNTNQMARMAGANGGAVKAFRFTSFEMRDTENRRTRAKALGEGKADPFKEQEAEFGSVYGVGDKIVSPLGKPTRKVVEVVKNNDGIFYAWMSENETGYCTERTLIRYGKA